MGLSLAEPKVPGPALRAGQVPHGAVPPLLKRNTIADFASTRAYQQASTTSLVSATAVTAAAADQGAYH